MTFDYQAQGFGKIFMQIFLDNFNLMVEWLFG
jgi:hypothetical protein